MSKINTIAVVGPGAKEIKGLRIPDGPLDFAAKSVYQGIKDDAPSGLKVLYAKGINYTDPHWSESDVENFALTDDEKKSINTTVAVARQWI